MHSLVPQRCPTWLLLAAGAAVCIAWCARESLVIIAEAICDALAKEEDRYRP